MTGQSLRSFPEQQALEMQDLTSAYQLGAPVTAYRGGFTTGSIVGVIFVVIFAFTFVAVVAGFVGSMSTSVFSTASLATFLLALVLFALPLLLFVWLGMVLPLRRWRFWRIYVFDHGFIFSRKGKQPDVFRWEEIQVVWWDERHYSSGYSTTIVDVYTIECRDGRRVVLDSKIHKVKELGIMIGQQVANVLWPQALAAYNAGNVLPFGPFNVSQQGVSKGKKFLPWTALKEIGINNGEVKIHEKGKWFSWSSMQVEKIPNVFLLLALTRFASQQGSR